VGVRLGIWAFSSFAFAIVDSTIHWREGLGWQGLHCLVGPVHRDAIPILAALSLLASHGAIEHLPAWARRLFAQTAARLTPALAGLPAGASDRSSGAARAGREHRSRPAAGAPLSTASLLRGVD